MRRVIAVAALVAGVGLAAASPASAARLEPVGSYASPVYVTSEPANADRLYVVERAGRIMLTTPSGTTTFADLRSASGGPVNAASGEQGLLSVALAPDYPANPRLYVYYTDSAGSIVVSELSASGDTAPLSSLRDVITIPHPTETNHNGGQLQFGPDGYLYIGTGDGGGGGDPFENGQALGSRLGKLLRIDPRQADAASYRVPTDNPYVGIAGAQPEIWSLGLRNPFRFSFDRVTGDLTIGDVGQANWEEIDFATRAAGGGRAVNWGWDCREGAHVYEATGCAGATFTDPVLEYGHAGGACSVTGGYVVRDPGLTELTGRYVYADFCVGGLRSAVLASPAASGDRSEGLTVSTISSFGEDACGRVYTVSLGGAVSRLVDDTPTDCSTLLPGPPPTPDAPFVPGPGPSDPGPGGPSDPGPGDPGPSAPPRGECGEITRGDGGADRLRGGDGSQELIGLGGDDSLKGGDGGDCLRGGGGDDSLNGGDGHDELGGGGGDDAIKARDGERDVVSCGPGEDRATVDRKDRLKGCERVRD